MEKYRELIDFAERIRAKGVPEQQYIAEGILELVEEVREREIPSQSDYVCQLPLRGALAGSIVEEANGDRWIVEGWVYEAKEVQDDFDREIRSRAVRRTFTQDELDSGIFRVVAEGVS